MTMSDFYFSRSLRPGAAEPVSVLSSVLLAVLLISALYLAREVLVPIALAVLMSFVLAPLVKALERLFTAHCCGTHFGVGRVRGGLCPRRYDGVASQPACK
jgi:hypothetical protein